MDKLKYLQDTLLDILKDVKEFLKEYDLKYCMIYGSAIGAIRHNGFIPWDDDLDICMKVEDVNKFIELFEKYGDTDKYYIKKIDENSKINHVKVILKDSPFIVDNASEEDQYNGLFLDIFPLYKVKKNKLKSMMAWNAVRLVYTRGYVAKKFGKAMHIASWCMLKLVPKCIQKKLYNYSCKYVMRYQNLDESECYRISLSTFQESKKPFTYDVFENLQTVKFEDTEVYISSHNHEMLLRQYGDYMQLPPEEERINKHNLVLKEDQRNV